jgi:hypothetical protein
MSAGRTASRENSWRKYPLTLFSFGNTVSSLYNCHLLSSKISSYYIIVVMGIYLDHLPWSPIPLRAHVHLVKGFVVVYVKLLL